MTLLKYLANLGYGSRREVAALLARRRITDADGRPLRETDAVDHDRIRVDGEPLDAPPGSVVVLNKPLGYVCSTSDATNPVVYELLPARFRLRSPIMAAVGRLDRDTSGLLLLTDDGALNHRLTSPRSHLPKVYRVTLAESLRGDEGERFAAGTLQLAGEAEALEPAQLEVIDERTVRVTLHEGRYHQVRRMFAAVGNHVVQLQRIAIGGLTLEQPPLDALALGAWCVLPPDVRERMLDRAPPTTTPTELPTAP